MNSCFGSGMTSANRPRICAWRSGSAGSVISRVASLSRWRCIGQLRRVLLFTQMYPSASSNQIGFSWMDSSSRLVAMTVRMGSAARRRTAGLRSIVRLAPAAIDGSRYAERLDPNLDPTGARALIILAHVAVRKVVDMLAARILRPIDHAAEDL